jgi:hypothetical protein
MAEDRISFRENKYETRAIIDLKRDQEIEK